MPRRRIQRRHRHCAGCPASPVCLQEGEEREGVTYAFVYVSSLLLTVQILGAAIETLLILLALLGGRLMIRKRGGKQTGTALHQKLDHIEIITAGGAVQRRPAI